jgi:hypothetical protein
MTESTSILAVKLAFNAAKAVVRGEALSDIEQLLSCMQDCYAKRELARILARTETDLATLRHAHKQQLHELM